MNTKTFAQQSRTILMEGVAKKLLYWGFDTKGEVLESPQKISGGYSFRGEVGDDPNVLTLWEALKKAVQQKGIEVVVEEASYTWFNRLMALRIMSKNGYEPSLLENAEGLEHTPLLLQKARQGQYAFLNITEQERLRKMIGDYNKDHETFALLLVGYCHSNKMLNTVFGKLDDYTELLLPDNMLQDSGFLHLLNTTDAISNEEYKQVELIGWLYQFYISERKDEVFASFKKKKKAEAKDIPAATQIFTPNWIVKYMVENTVGKIWLDKKRNSPLKSQMKYMVENENDQSSPAIISEVKELTLLDPAVGSGHILVEGFDLLYQMYMEEHYMPEEAVESILKNNLFGLDIDNRAVQLATFAILLKAATKYRDVFAKGWLPNVYAMPEAEEFSMQEVKDFLGSDGADYAEELEAALRLMKQAKNLGSVMKIMLGEKGQQYIGQRFEELKTASYHDFSIEVVFQRIQSYIPILLMLTKKYSSVVANPPYMGSRNMNAELKGYVTKKYPNSKNDLLTIFIERTNDLTISKGRYGLITLHGWMFTSTFEKLRENIIHHNDIESLIHVGRGLFGSDSGSVTFTMKKEKFRGGTRLYKKLFIKEVNVDSIIEKEKRFFDESFGVYNFDQDNIDKIPGFGIAYWLGPASLKMFDKENAGENIIVKQGLATTENKKFLRIWHEVDLGNIGFSLDRDAAFKSNYKWFPYNKGGDFRKWYGNQIYIIDWSNDGMEIKENVIRKYPYLNGNTSFVLKETNPYFKESVSWTDLSWTVGGRFYPKGFLFDVAGHSTFYNNENDLLGSLAYINTNFLNMTAKVVNSTFHFQIGDFKKVPYPEEYIQCVDKNLVKRNIKISQTDWDSRETSWDFKQSPLLNGTNTIENAYYKWQELITQDFFQLHSNEEELNRIFINIYNLKEELTPEVALKDVTILQKELKKNDMGALEESFRIKGKDFIELPIDKGEVISQFVSYSIGLFMGRYRLDTPGLNIAHPNPKKEELSGHTFNKGKVIIDDDAIIPLMGKNCNFPDDILQQFNNLLDTIWGHEKRTVNINFIQECLDKDLEKFLVKDFYKYHCGMYEKKPIYWLFASPKGAFQVLVYMHRMNAFTVEKIRANYLLEHIKNIRSEIIVLEGNSSNLNTQEAKRLDQVRNDLIECEAYDMELKDIADEQIEFDLDDGVTVNYAKFKSVVAKL